MAGGHVRRRLSFGNGSAGWVQECAFGTGFLCLRDKCRVAPWNTIPACSQTLALLKTIGLESNWMGIIAYDVTGANCENSLYKN